MLKSYRSDLHIHTCLSPCSDLTMSPRRIVQKALDLNLDIIAICDHNSAENVQATIKASSKNRIRVLPGMEITTVEEVHIISLFDNVESILELQQMVYQNLAPGENDENIFGQQIVANELDEVESFSNRLLIGSTSFTLKELEQKIHALGGLVFAAHIDREVFSILGQLGFIPEDLSMDALEISPNINLYDAKEQFPGIEKFPIISASDAHHLDDIGKSTTSFLLETACINEIRKALNREDGRALDLEE
jgi:PHP family Zn ribbon phosphoesterase